MKIVLLMLALLLGGCNLLGDSSTPDSSHVGSDMGTDSDEDIAVQASCSDRLKNGSETDLNCGGRDCRPCTDHLSCVLNSDCSSRHCDAQVCAPARCNDRIHNGDETDIDCGGSCNPCENGAACIVVRDCESGICETLTCRAPCENTCGLMCPNRCALGESCEEGDCGEGLICDPTIRVCKTPVANSGWQREVSFETTTASTKFYAYVRVPDLNDSEIANVYFEQSGNLLPHEVADEFGAFWVFFDEVGLGENTFNVKMVENQGSSESPIWDDFVAVYHAPGVQPIVSSAGLNVESQTNVKSTEGPFGAASFFDGAAAVQTTGGGIENLYPRFSISLWMKPSIISEDWKPLIGRQFGTTHSDDFALGAFRSGSVWACTNGTCAISFNPIPTDDWTFVTMTYNNGKMKLYINGEPDAEREGPRMESTAQNPLLIGADIDNAMGTIDHFYTGGIDEVRFSTEIFNEDSINLQYISADPNFFAFGTKEELD